MNKLEIENGKYQIENNNGIVKVYRHGELWLDGVTKFELCLIQRVEELEDKCNYLSDMNEMLLDLNGVLPDEPELYIKLKKEIKRLEDFIETIQNVHFVELQREKAENRRYRKALEEIYELAEYDEYDNTLEQIVSEVEKALGSEENEMR